jgi:hypothetical protein
MSTLQMLENIVIKEKVLLHGSPNYFYELRPSRILGKRIVCATQFAEIAVLMAILRACRGKIIKYQPVSSAECPYIDLRIKLAKLHHLLSTDEAIGYVYMIDRDGFKKESLEEFRIFEPRFVRKPIKVTKADLPFVPVPGTTTYRIPLKAEIFKAFPVWDYFP